MYGNRVLGLMKAMGHKQHIYLIASTLPFFTSFAYSGDSADVADICRVHLLQLYLNSAVEYAGLTQSEGWGSVTLCSLRH